MQATLRIRAKVAVPFFSWAIGSLAGTLFAAILVRLVVAQ